MTKAVKLKLEQELTSAHANFVRELNIYAFSKTHRRGIGEDLVQETFKKTWWFLLKGGDVVTMKAFLYHILNDLLVDEYRKKHQTISLDALLEKGFEPGVDSSQRLFNTLDGKKVIMLIDRLPVNYQKVMRMRYVQELSHKEISLITGQTKNTIAVQVYRGLIKLRALYNAN